MPAVEGGTVCIIGAGGSMGASIIGALAVRAVVAWEELGGAFLAGLRAPRLERPNERFFICAQTPLSKIGLADEISTVYAVTF